MRDVVVVGHAPEPLPEGAPVLAEPVCEVLHDEHDQRGDEHQPHNVKHSRAQRGRHPPRGRPQLTPQASRACLSGLRLH
eukprot:3297074-Pyramimonas_sp.AAC.2